MKREKQQSNFITSSEQYNVLILQYRELAYQYLERIESCLKNKSIQSITEFIHIFEEPNMLPHCVRSLAELAYAHIFVVITVDEIQKYGYPNFLMVGNSIRELIAVLKQVQFRMWEVEFDGSKESEEKLYDILKIYRITPEAMKSIIEVAAMNKVGFYHTLSCIYLEKKEIDNAVKLLQYAVDYFPEEENLLQLLIQLCDKTNRTGVTEKYRRRLECKEQ